jgi:hypothetical protein
MMATPVAAGTRSSVRHEPSDNADTAIPEAPSGREPITPATLPPRDVPHPALSPRDDQADVGLADHAFWHHPRTS